MSHSTRESIYEAIAAIRLIDPHTHINPHAPASSTLADLLGYHYYTELAHSAGMPKDQIEQEDLSPRELVRRLVSNLKPIENTAQYRWLVEICRMFFGFDEDRIDQSNWEALYDSAENQMASAQWPQMVLDQSNVEAVFLTNDFDDDLAGFDTDTYIPCLRTDDLVFHLSKDSIRQRLEGCTGVELESSLWSLRKSLDQRFRHFISRGARACAISLPPTFEPTRVSDGRATTALDHVLRKGPLADDSHKNALSRRVFWTLAELCDEYGLPLDLMIGVNRGVYADGVFQGQDLYDSRVSLIQYRELFNAFANVNFPVSVLASVTNQELVSYSWIFPNVITNGHWWYSNMPSVIARDAAARLEAVPQSKQIGYYSDAYKLEFIWPKFDMYRRVLAGILADHFVAGCGWSEERAVELGRQILRTNVDEIFPKPSVTDDTQSSRLADMWSEETGDAGESSDESSETPTETWAGVAAAGSSAALAAGGIGMVEVSEAMESQPDSEEDSDETDQNLEGDAEDVPPDPSAETISLDETGSEDDDFSELPTMVESDTSDETVRIEDELEWDAEFADANQADAPASFETLLESDAQDEAVRDLDPLPSAEELQSVQAEDVELADDTSQRAGGDAESIDAEADSEPLDLDAMLAEEDSDEAAEDVPEIRLLRNEESFETDEDSLRVTPDPSTGELKFPVGDSGDDDDDLLLDLGVDEAEDESGATDEQEGVDDEDQDDGFDFSGLLDKE